MYVQMALGARMPKEWDENGRVEERTWRIGAVVAAWKEYDLMGEHRSFLLVRQDPGLGPEPAHVQHHQGDSRSTKP